MSKLKGRQCFSCKIKNVLKACIQFKNNSMLLNRSGATGRHCSDSVILVEIPPELGMMFNILPPTPACADSYLGRDCDSLQIKTFYEYI
jgi:hypothetical protein